MPSASGTVVALGVWASVLQGAAGFVLPSAGSLAPASQRVQQRRHHHHHQPAAPTGRSSLIRRCVAANPAVDGGEVATDDVEEQAEGETVAVNAGAEAASPKKALRTVIKFGGSSLATSKRLKEVSALVKLLIDEGQMPIMVCSAMGKTTNNLLNAGEFALTDGKVYIDAIQTLHLSACDELELGEHTKSDIESLLADLRHMLEGVGMLRELTQRSRDRLVSYGERMSVRMMAAVLNKAGVPAQHFDAWTLGMRTTDEFGNADVLDESYPLIKETLSKFDPSMVAVVTGFLGQSPCKQITTLGRGGSDLTATVIGVACGADEVQVWKDVDGMMTADPRAVPGAVPVPCVSYEEAAELAYFGANILHPVSMRPVIKTGLPVRIKNSYNPSHPGTVIAANRDCGETLVTAITFKKGVELVDIVSTRMLGQSGCLERVGEFAEVSEYPTRYVASPVPELFCSRRISVFRMNLA
ncbi:aspartate kinase [Ectocarpus siliculosus]|uniref:Aspartokinase n=1 Tax=Ectocarpus siliculosus TaxID=2880 RepID=D7FXQ9_ECTSI|nr:aspartate kinase [Ectocarpus siliculosus]|eukprot:CBJ32322.1 aspartate kinase [Ectocarpus siliculosus]